MMAIRDLFFKGNDHENRKIINYRWICLSTFWLPNEVGGDAGTGSYLGIEPCGRNKSSDRAS